MEVSIVIVNYNTFSLTKNCIDSIIKNSKNFDYEIIVIDNSSTDRSIHELNAIYNDVRIIESKQNLGFGRANNIGAAIAKGDYILFLNSDCILIENSIKYLLDFYKEFSSKFKIGVLGSLLINNDLEIINSYGSFPTVFKEIQSFFSNRLIKRNKKESLDVNIQSNYFQVDYVSGANMFLERKLFDKVGGFDDCFFIYFEETDLQFRLSNIGYKSFILPIKSIIHLEDGSTDNVDNASQWKRVTFKDSRFKYIKRNDKRYLLFYIFNLTFGLISFLNFKYSFKQNYQFYKTGLF